MFKKIIVIGAGLLLCSNVLADVTPYAGIEVAADHETMQLKDAIGARLNTSTNGGQGGIFAGLGSAVNSSLYASIEVF